MSFSRFMFNFRYPFPKNASAKPPGLKKKKFGYALNNFVCNNKMLFIVGNKIFYAYGLKR